MGVRTKIVEGLQPLVDLVYPPRCPACGESVASQGGLCLNCWNGIVSPEGNDIAGNGEPIGEKSVIAATLYNDISRKLILSFKHGGKTSLAKLLGQMMASKLPLANGDHSPLIVPVPLHRTRLWQRGYNQAALLARDLSNRHRGELLVDGLVRTKRTPSLGGLGKKERRTALNGSIAIRKSRATRLQDRRILLVDDVLTSGATSDACIAALKSGGARSVQLVCFARVVD